MRKMLVLMFLVSGCSSVSVRPMSGPGGAQAYSISCKRGIENCYEQASISCPGGYNIVNSGGRATAFVPAGGNLIPVHTDNIFIECKQ